MSKCLTCGKELTKKQTKFCCQECKSEYFYNLYIQDWLDEKESGLVGLGISNHIKKFMLRKSNYQCELCGWSIKNPFTNTLPLEIHHIDGDYTNNRESNLQVLCPNCHSLTENYKGANKSNRNRNQYSSRKNHCIDCGKEIAKGSTRCKSCAKKKELVVSREELKELIRNYSFVYVARLYEVSCNAIRKWCDKYGLPRLSKEIKSYTDEEWKLL